MSIKPTSSMFPVSAVFNCPCFDKPVEYEANETYASLLQLSEYKFRGGSKEALHLYVQQTFPKWEQPCMVNLIEAAGNSEKIVTLMKQRFPFLEQKLDVEEVNAVFNQLKEKCFKDLKDITFSLLGRVQAC